jgi:hypothetical protein
MARNVRALRLHLAMQARADCPQGDNGKDRITVKILEAPEEDGWVGHLGTASARSQLHACAQNQHNSSGAANARWACHAQPWAPNALAPARLVAAHLGTPPWASGARAGPRPAAPSMSARSGRGGVQQSCTLQQGCAAATCAGGSEYPCDAGAPGTQWGSANHAPRAYTARPRVRSSERGSAKATPRARSRMQGSTTANPSGGAPGRPGAAACVR